MNYLYSISIFNSSILIEPLPLCNDFPWKLLLESIQDGKNKNYNYNVEIWNALPTNEDTIFNYYSENINNLPKDYYNILYKEIVDNGKKPEEIKI